MISVTEALHIVDERTAVLPEETVDLSDALGRALAREIVAGDNIPPFDNSAMDGYAVHAADVLSARKDSPVVLDITGEVPAGSTPETALNRGQAVRIMTGGMLPQGADAVVRVEDTRTDGNRVEIYKSAETGLHCRRAGEDIRKGSRVFSRGDVIRPAGMGVLASLGITNVPVIRRPRAAFLITGDELLESEMPLQPGKIRNSNRFSLAGLLQECGVAWRDLGVGRDSREEIKTRIAAGCDEADLVITSGAVSVGKYDFVKDALGELGMKRHFWKVAQKPGKPLLFGERGGTLFFGLPGNPVSVMVTFLVYVKPALLKMKGCAHYATPRIQAVLTSPCAKTAGLTHFVRGKHTVRDGVVHAAPLKQQGSGMLRAMNEADCLIVLDEKSTGAPAGSFVDILRLW